jgi:ATP-binding cassette subfamily C (CFTR/MRP) protein 1
LAFYSLILRGYNEVILSMAPVLSSILAFGVYSYLNGADKLTPAKVYSCLALFNLISNPMRLIMLAFIQFINTVAGLRRVDHFLNYQ